ncbi:MAG TPA: F0F1 ATP synthase subunit delta [Alphaproteobacteria bacterium]|nr:F0F1 ATP synthase subunit delta [Alphaproteobacteria bacterium]HNS45208.1 F0F1 ATP synthase subunit delta [Alphaproteobacteria bacterium]
MHLDLTTFILELINFAVLVWILNRFLFRPVMAVMDKRRADIRNELEEAKRLRDEADGMCAQYEGRLEDWNKEKDAAYAELSKELSAEREKGMAAVRTTAEEEAQRIAAAEEKKRSDWQRAIEQRALQQGGVFAAKFLERMAGPELDEKMTEIFLSDLGGWTDDRRNDLVSAAKSMGGAVTVTTARQLDDAVKYEFEKTLAQNLGTELAFAYEQDPSVLSGLRISVGPWVIKADIASELAFFTNGTSHGD